MIGLVSSIYGWRSNDQQRREMSPSLTHDNHQQERKRDPRMRRFSRHLTNYRSDIPRCSGFVTPLLLAPSLSTPCPPPPRRRHLGQLPLSGTTKSSATANFLARILFAPPPPMRQRHLGHLEEKQKKILHRSEFSTPALPGFSNP